MLQSQKSSQNRVLISRQDCIINMQLPIPKLFIADFHTDSLAHTGGPPGALIATLKRFRVEKRPSSE